MNVSSKIFFSLIIIFSFWINQSEAAGKKNCIGQLQKISNDLQNISWNKWNSSNILYRNQLKEIGVILPRTSKSGFRKLSLKSAQNILKKKTSDWESGAKQPKGCNQKVFPTEIEEDKGIVLNSPAPIIEKSIGNCNQECEELGTIAISEEGLEKLSHQLFQSNKKEIQNEIVRNSLVDKTLKSGGIVKSGNIEAVAFETPDDCRYSKSGGGLRYLEDIKIVSKSTGGSCFGFPSKTKDWKLDLGKKPIPVKMQFVNGEVENIDLDMPRPPKCENLKCKVRVKVNSVRVRGDVEVKNKKNGKNEFQASNLIFSAKSTEKDPIFYEFEAILNPKTGALENFARVKDKGADLGISRIHMDLNFEETEETRVLLGAAAFDGVCSVFDKNGSNKFNKKRWRRELEKHGRNLSKKGYPQQKIEKMIKKREKKEFVDGVREVCQLSAIPPEPFSDRTIELNKSDSFKFIERNSEDKFLQISIIDKAVSKSMLKEMMRQGGAPTPEALGAKFMALDLMKPMFFGGNKGSELIAEKIQENLSEINLNINDGLTRLPEYFNEALVFEAPPIQLAVKILDRKDKIGKITKEYEEAAKAGDEADALRIKNELAELAQELKGLLEEQKEFTVKLDLKVVTSQLEKLPGGVNFNISSGEKGCIRKIKQLDVSENEKFDIRSEITLEALNKMVSDMYDADKLEVCSNPNKLYKNCDNWGVKLSGTPKITGDKDGYNVVINKAKVGGPAGLLGRLDGEVSVKMKLKPVKCNQGRSVCLELKDNKGKWHGTLALFGAGYAVKKATASAVKPLGAVGVDLPPELRLLRDPKINENGGLIMDWSVSPPLKDPFT